MKEKRRIALLDWDMTVTGGVEAVARLSDKDAQRKIRRLFYNRL